MATPDSEVFSPPSPANRVPLIVIAVPVGIIVVGLTGVGLWYLCRRFKLRRKQYELNPEERDYAKRQAADRAADEHVAQLPLISFPPQQVIGYGDCIHCRNELAEGEAAKLLPCGHLLHPDCSRNFFRRYFLGSVRVVKCPDCIHFQLYLPLTFQRGGGRPTGEV